MCQKAFFFSPLNIRSPRRRRSVHNHVVDTDGGMQEGEEVLDIFFWQMYVSVGCDVMSLKAMSKRVNRQPNENNTQYFLIKLLINPL